MSLMRDASDSFELFELPRDSYDLIDLLDKALPHRCISVGESLEKAHRYAGARELVDSLVEMKREELEGERDESSEDGAV